ncbi:MAG: DUF262 domain-containing HNH endonuclease family protein [Rhodocyclaceae bacterium]|nr:DUF262 domain-containing HNH endonuclease family protein [Rhodocyclaceae bacterium]
MCFGLNRGAGQYDKDNPSYEFLKVMIFQEQSDIHSLVEETIYTTNLRKAKEFFVEKIKQIKKKSDLEKIYSKITQNLLFNIYTISNDIDVFVAFETMNNRGIPLSHLELLKNRLIFLSTKFKVATSEKSSARKTINESWKTVYHYLGKNENNPLNDDQFLLTHFLLYYGPGILKEQKQKDEYALWQYRHHDQFKNHLLETVFTPRAINGHTEEGHKPLAIKDLIDFSRNIKGFVQTYYEIHNPADSRYSDAEKIQLERIGRLARFETMLLIAALYLKCKDQTLRLNVLGSIETTQFLLMIQPSLGGREQSFDAQSFAVRLQAGEYDAPRIAELYRDNLAELMRAIDFQAVLKEWARRGEGYYQWKGVKYFLYEYEQSLRAASKTKREKLTWDEFQQEDFTADHSTVEHIYPQKATEDCWRSPFEKYSVKQRNILRHSLGNLLPLSKGKNSALRNYSFDVKKGDATNKVGYVYGCYSENEVALCSEWTAQEILERGIRLLEFMEKRWGFNIGDRTAKQKALGLEFVETNKPTPKRVLVRRRP